MGWTGLKNGDLLRAAAASAFEVFITVDRNVAFQQNVAELMLPVVVLCARSNLLHDLVPLVPALLRLLPDAKIGDVRRVPEKKQ